MQRIKNFWNKNLVNKVILGTVGFVVVCCLFGMVLTIFSPDQSNTAPDATSVQDSSVEDANPAQAAVPTETPLPTNTPEPTATPIPTETPDPNLIAPGTYLVGTDIQPGIYKGIAGEGLFDSCYWERSSDLTGDLNSILANDNGIGQIYVEIKDGDFAFKTDCEMSFLNPIPEHTGDYPIMISAGTYLVGNDIRPGTYKGQAGTDILDSCYWERLSGVSGDFSSLLGNDNAIGQYYVQVLPSDFALRTGCDLEWVSE